MKRIIFLIALVSFGFSTEKPPKKKRPNVIIVMTDDQGIGDLSCHGNPWLKTPNLDVFYKESVRFTDFHVSPLCAPTRSAIVTGRYPINNGAWATFKGRDAISTASTPTIAEIFKENGYKTGLFGKWHLGDNYPVRPTDCGFDVAVHHKAGGVGELSDYWGNSYFDDTYYVNNQPTEFEGYCTDVWFSEAMKFMQENSDEPFFVYLPTNAPHSPLIVDEKYAEPYRELVGKNIISAEYLGMIANIDENFGKLTKFLKEEDLEKNTVLIFLTDNGTQYGFSHEKQLGFNKGFRGNKSDKLEGGHRVPFFIRWPQAKVKGGKDIDGLAAHVDILPTLAGLCSLEIPQHKKLDGVDLSNLLLEKNQPFPDRSVFIHHRQDWRQPHDVDQTCILNGKWRLLNGTELYDVEADPLQQNDVAEQNQELVEKLLKENAEFLSKTKKLVEYAELPVAVVGTEHQKEITFTIQHAIGEGRGIWKAEQVSAGMTNSNNTHALEIASDGRYKISCRRWPKECPGPVLGVPDYNPKDMYEYKSISPQKVRIQIANQIWEKKIEAGEDAVEFELELGKGKTFLVNDFLEGDKKYGVYYTYVEKIEE